MRCFVRRVSGWAAAGAIVVSIGCGDDDGAGADGGRSGDGGGRDAGSTADDASVDGGASERDAAPDRDGSAGHDGGGLDASADASISGSLDACFAGLGPTDGRPWVGTLTFETEDGTTRLRLARQIGDRRAVGETFAYDLVRFAIQRGESTECLTEASALSYEFGHHNWDDEARAQGASAYVVHMQYVAGEPAEWVDELTIDDGTPVPLRFVACDVIPEGDINHCLFRRTAR